jgi:hypothetical protein
MEIITAKAAFTLNHLVTNPPLSFFHMAILAVLRRKLRMPMAADVDTIERTSIVTYTLLRELHEVLALPQQPDDVTLGMLMGLSMFLDEKVGPMRAKRLMTEAPTIVLKTDAHVTPEQMQRIVPVLRAFGDHLKETRVTAEAPAPSKVI